MGLAEKIDIPGRDSTSENKTDNSRGMTPKFVHMHPQATLLLQPTDIYTHVNKGWGGAPQGCRDTDDSRMSSGSLSLPCSVLCFLSWVFGLPAVVEG